MAFLICYFPYTNSLAPHTKKPMQPKKYDFISLLVKSKQASKAPAGFKKKEMVPSHTALRYFGKHTSLKGLPASVIVNSNTLKISVLKPHSGTLK
jgi:hypothetical protein